MATPPPKPAKTPAKAKPTDNDKLKKYLMWGFVLVGIVAIGWMIYASPKEKTLRCNSNGGTSLNGFGTCTEE